MLNSRLISAVAKLVALLWLAQGALPALALATPNLLTPAERAWLAAGSASYRFLVAVMAALALVTTAHAAPILQVDGSGQLTGATGVDVGGTLYDVQFLDGTCGSLFGGCDQVSDFTFQTQAAGQAAADALLAQVFLDVVGGGLFDSDASLTNGCVFSQICLVETPFGLNTGVVSTAIAINRSESQGFVDGTQIGTINNNSDTSGGGSGATSVWASWSPHVATVPEPGTMALAALGLMGLGLSRRSQPKAG